MNSGLPYYVVNAFTETPFGGNPAAVCTETSRWVIPKTCEGQFEWWAPIRDDEDGDLGEQFSTIFLAAATSRKNFGKTSQTASVCVT